MSNEEFSLKGYTLPLTPKGQSSLVEPPPWYYGGEVMQIIFKTDAQKARELIPRPLEPGPEPGTGIIWFVEWVSVSESNPDLAFTNPERAVYRECLVMLQCSYQGAPGYTVPFIWVDNDFALMRGFIQGFPKKLGRIYQTKLAELNPKTGGKRVGARFKSLCVAHTEKVAEGSLIFTRKASESELPKLRFYLMRHFPSIEDPSRPAIHELAVSNVKEFKVGDVWAGDADLKFFESNVDEVAALKPTTVLGGFYHNIGLTISGGKVIYKY